MNTQGNVLILEDDATLRTMLSEVLQDEGYAVTACGSGESAVEAASAARLDLVVLDVRMPGLDGLDALALMHEHLGGAAALVMTGYASEADTIRALRLGVADYLKKPFELSLFLQKVTDLIQLTRQRRAQGQREERLSALARWSPAGILQELKGASLTIEERRRIVQAVQTALRLGELLGTPTPELEEMGMGCAIMCLKSLRPDGHPTAASYPEPMRQILENPQNLSACIASLCCSNALGLPSDSPLPPRWNGLVQQALTIAKSTPSGAAKLAPRATLELGWALLRSGDYEHAQEAFSRLQTSDDAQLRLEAQLYLAEAFRLSRNRNNILPALERARQLALTIGPVQHARTTLRGAILCIRAALSVPAPWLESCRKLFAQLQLEQEEARAILAQATQCNLPHDEMLSAMEVWLNNSDLPLIGADTEWLSPTIIALVTESTSEVAIAYRRHLQRLLRLFPKPFANALAQNTLPKAQADELRRQMQKAYPYLPRAIQEQIAPISKVSENLSSPYRISPQRPTLQVLALGESAISVSGQGIDEREWHTSKTKFLLFYLLSHPQGVLEDTILEEFWPQNWETGKQNLYSATSRLRRVLKCFYPHEETFVKRQNGRLQWQQDLPLWYDWQQMRRIASQPPSANSLNLWHRAVELYGGPFLPGCEQEWAISLRREAERLFNTCLYNLSKHYFESDLPEESLEYAQRLLHLDELDQNGCELALRSMLRLNQHERALRLYRHFSLKLRQELNAEPNCDLMRLYHQARLGLHG